MTDYEEKGHSLVRDLLTQVRAGLNVNLYYLSLYVTLTIPDICGALESNNGQAQKSKYTSWFDRYIGPQYQGFLTADDCYSFRNSILHQGSSQPQHPRASTYSRILFVEPGAYSGTLHSNVLEDALNIDVGIFCDDILTGAERWLAQVEGTQPYETNYDRFLKRYQNGLPPYIVGIPVIG